MAGRRRPDRPRARHDDRRARDERAARGHACARARRAARSRRHRPGRGRPTLVSPVPPGTGGVSLPRHARRPAHDDRVGAGSLTGGETVTDPPRPGRTRRRDAGLGLRSARGKATYAAAVDGRVRERGSRVRGASARDAREVARQGGAVTLVAAGLLGKGTSSSARARRLRGGGRRGPPGGAPRRSLARPSCPCGSATCAAVDGARRPVSACGRSRASSGTTAPRRSSGP